MPGADPIDAILNSLAIHERALAPPLDATKQPIVYDTFIGEPSAYPAFINIPRSGRVLHADSNLRMWKWTVDALLIFSSGDSGFANSAQRKWVPVVLNYFDTHARLSDTVQLAEVTSIVFDPIILNEIPYVGITFEFEMTVSEAYTFLPNG